MKEKLFFGGEEVKSIPKVTSNIDPKDINNDENDETDIPHPTEIAEAIREINKDEPEVDGKMSSIDRTARITRVEKTAYHSLLSLITMDFAPKSSLFLIRAGLRLSVSLDGKGRKEVVEIVRGVKDAESKSGFIDKFSGVFSGNTPPK